MSEATEGLTIPVKANTASRGRSSQLSLLPLFVFAPSSALKLEAPILRAKTMSPIPITKAPIAIRK